MKLKEVLSRIVENKKNGQLNTSIRKNELKKIGITDKDLFDLNIDSKLKMLLKD